MRAPLAQPVGRDQSRDLVLGALKAARTASVRDLALATGLSGVTVGTVLQGLVDRGQAVDQGLEPSRGGRPSRRYGFRPEASLVLAVLTREVEGQDRIYAGVADLYGQVLRRAEAALGENVLEAFETFLDPLIKEFPALRALAFALPGIEAAGTIVANDYWSLVGSPFVAQVEARYNLPVLVENDVNAAAMGHGLGKGRPGEESLAYLYAPAKYAPGVGLRVGGRLIKGAHHYAGEVDLLPLGLLWGSPPLSLPGPERNLALARVIMALTAVVDPARVVLHDEALGHEGLAQIEGHLARSLPAGALPRLDRAEDFTQDVEAGLIGLALDLASRHPISPSTR